MKKYFLEAVIIFLGIILISCKKNKTITCNGTDATYNANVKTIINANCTGSGCHPSYSSYSGIKNVLDNGAFNSKVIEQKTMPKGKRLSDDELSILKCWVDGGYKEN